jgi:hypothetical protein
LTNQVPAYDQVPSSASRSDISTPSSNTPMREFPELLELRIEIALNQRTQVHQVHFFFPIMPPRITSTPVRTKPTGPT